MAEVLASHQAELPSNGKLNEEVKNSKEENHPSKDSPKSNNSEDDKDGEVLNENGEEKGFVREPSTPMPVFGRPARERKSVDRFIASADRDKVKEFKIEKGHGTELRDIPNVAYKLSKRTGADESVQQLHKLLFAKRAKNHITKQNILQFSGFVWGENKEKEKAKVKERFEKCFKDGLHQVSDLLDLNLPKSGKKEDYVTKLLEFLESPQKLTDKLLEEKEQKLKEKKKLKKSKKRSRKGTPAKTPGKRQRSIGSAEKPSKEDVKGEDEDMEEAEDMDEQSEEDEMKKSSEESGDIENEVKSRRSRRGLSSSEDLEDEVVNDSTMKQENDKGDSSDSDDEDYGSRAKKRRARKQAKKSLKKEANGSNLEDVYMDDSQDNKALKNGSKIEKEDAQAKPPKKPKNDSISSEPEDKERVSTHNSPVNQEKLKTSTKNETASSKVSSRRKEGVDLEVKAKTPTGKSKDKTCESKASGKVKGKLEEEETKVVPSPSEEELRASICEILKEADFNTVTFANVVEQLETRCKANLADMKSRVKSLIREEISKLAEAAEDEDGEDEQEVAAEEKSV